MKRHQGNGLPESDIGVVRRGRGLRRIGVALGVAVLVAGVSIGVIFVGRGHAPSRHVADPQSPNDASTTSTSRDGLKSTTTTVPPTTTTTVPPTTTTVPPTTTTTVTPGTLPQTSTVPSGQTAGFEAEMAGLWQAVVSGTPTPGLPAFFPETAYAQLKLANTVHADWQDRLVHEYDLDISAAHRLISTPQHATLTAVQVSESYAHWIPPGVCTNTIGYYEVPNARVVYQENGVTRSFGIASMISWRGQWYVVHFGAILRGTTTGNGEVDEPGTGPGSSAYSSTC